MSTAVPKQPYLKTVLSKKQASNKNFNKNQGKLNSLKLSLRTTQSTAMARSDASQSPTINPSQAKLFLVWVKYLILDFVSIMV